ncbi:hypothetical protein OGAPHI_005425 [Ogataea philodendri]|uniref:Uncharacterized protein n=1 Tax=Ogataea philodendri TaxID=1378263 RepID=A0A9P8NZ02_9ASCO|nr:uncharacterized protein OGAPHI_005425 [Ogataea philodendri]KAH3662177.1 hypothetical protein OGAPHI_005425 [Ogataea philodendri]
MALEQFPLNIDDLARKQVLSAVVDGLENSLRQLVDLCFLASNLDGSADSPSQRQRPVNGLFLDVLDGHWWVDVSVSVTEHHWSIKRLAFWSVHHRSRLPMGRISSAHSVTINHRQIQSRGGGDLESTQSIASTDLNWEQQLRLLVGVLGHNLVRLDKSVSKKLLVRNRWRSRVADGNNTALGGHVLVSIFEINNLNGISFSQVVLHLQHVGVRVTSTTTAQNVGSDGDELNVCLIQEPFSLLVDGWLVRSEVHVFRDLGLRFLEKRLLDNILGSRLKILCLEPSVDTNTVSMVPSRAPFSMIWLTTFSSSSLSTCSLVVVPGARCLISPISAETLPIAAPIALATLWNGGLITSEAPSRCSGTMNDPPPTARTIMSSELVFILSITFSIMILVLFLKLAKYSALNLSLTARALPITKSPPSCWSAATEQSVAVTSEPPNTSALLTISDPVESGPMVISSPSPLTKEPPPSPILST